MSSSTDSPRNDSGGTSRRERAGGLGTTTTEEGNSAEGGETAGTWTSGSDEPAMSEDPTLTCTGRACENGPLTHCSTTSMDEEGILIEVRGMIKLVSGFLLPLGMVWHQMG